MAKAKGQVCAGADDALKQEGGSSGNSSFPNACDIWSL